MTYIRIWLCIILLLIYVVRRILARVNLMIGNICHFVYLTTEKSKKECLQLPVNNNKLPIWKNNNSAGKDDCSKTSTNVCKYVLYIILKCYTLPGERRGTAVRRVVCVGVAVWREGAVVVWLVCIIVMDWLMDWLVPDAATGTPSRLHVRIYRGKNMVFYHFFAYMSTSTWRDTEICSDIKQKYFHVS